MIGVNEDPFVGPYRGLEPFDESAAAFFFGRERETRLITASLFAAPLTLLYGASGVGKSSVLRAGVLPALRRRPDLLPVVFPRIAQARSGRTAIERGWQADPAGGIKETVAFSMFELARDDPARQDAYRDAVLAGDRPLADFLAMAAKLTGRRLMIILDQFEEYSLYHPDEDSFAEQFPRALAAGHGAVSFLLSLREDALGKLDRFKGRIPTLWDSYRRIDHLSLVAAEGAIRLPLTEYNRRRAPGEPEISIEEPLVRAVLQEVRTESVQFESTGTGTLEAPSGPGRIETPYLQLVMTRLWEREQAAQSATLRLWTLVDEGGAARIVQTHLDRVMDQLTSEEQDLAAKVFQRLVTPSGAKIAFSVRDLALYEAVDPEKLAPVLRRLEEGSRRILRRVAVRTGEPGGSDDVRYEIFHDRLGKAVLSWRAKRLEEQARDLQQRQEMEQRRVAEESGRSARGLVESVSSALSEEGRALWASLIPFLVGTDGQRFAVTAADLRRLARIPGQALEDLLPRLEGGKLLRRVDGVEGQALARYTVYDDTTARALLEWLPQYVHAQVNVTGPVSDAAPPVDAEPLTPRSDHLVTRVLDAAGRALGFGGRARGAESLTPASQGDPSQRDEHAPAHPGGFPYRLVRDLLAGGRVVPLLGAGASLSARGRTPGSGRDLKEALARMCDFPRPELGGATIAEVASFFVERAGRPRLDLLLDELLGAPDFAPSDTHRFLAEVATSTPLKIVTTNYDRLMERALDEAGVPHDVVSYVPDQTGGRDRITHWAGRDLVFTMNARDVSRDYHRCTVVRLHGGPPHRAGLHGGYVITEEDQIDWIFRVRSGTAIPVHLYPMLRASPLLLLGLSLRDWAQRELVRIVSTGSDRHSTGWAVGLWYSPLTVATFQRCRVGVFNLDLNDWVARMRAGESSRVE